VAAQAVREQQPRQAEAADREQQHAGEREVRQRLGGAEVQRARVVGDLDRRAAREDGGQALGG